MFTHYRATVIILILTLFIVPLLACQASAPTSTPTPTPVALDPFALPWDDRAVFRLGLVDAEEEVLTRLPGATIYRLDLLISDDLLRLEGQERVRYTNQEGQSLDEVYFRLFPNIAGGTATVSGLQIDGQDVQAFFELQDSALRVPLPRTLQPGEQVIIQMDFKVEVAQEMTARYGLFGYFDGVLVLDEFYPVIPVYDDEGWNLEIPSPYGDATYHDASFYLVRVTAPASLTVVASGILVSREELEPDRQVLTFAAGPARDFYLAASENYIAISETVGETTINSYAAAERIEGAKLALQFAADALRSFNRRLGAYPYTELDVVSTPMQALGMEYPGVVAIALNLYDLKGEVKGPPANMMEGTVAHEVAHQWFYNVVGNDQIDEPWLDEAMAQYLTGLYYMDAHGEAAAHSYRSSWESRWDRIERAKIPIGLPVKAYSDTEYSAIVYGRGPLFLAALAEAMGQEVFDEFLRDYYQSHKWSIGTSEAFKQLAEQHCHCDLTALFQNWVYGN